MLTLHVDGETPPFILIFVLLLAPTQAVKFKLSASLFVISKEWTCSLY